MRVHEMSYYYYLLSLLLDLSLSALLHLLLCCCFDSYRKLKSIKESWITTKRHQMSIQPSTENTGVTEKNGLLALLSGAAAFVEAEGKMLESLEEKDHREGKTRKYREKREPDEQKVARVRKRRETKNTTTSNKISSDKGGEAMTTEISNRPFLMARNPSSHLVSHEETTHAIIPTAIEEAVSRSVSIITSELLRGVWWSPNHPDNLDDNGGMPRGSNGYHQSNHPEPPIAHLIRFSHTLELFSKNVIGPTLTAHHVQDNQGRRAFLAACMMLREVLITNAEGIFYPAALSREVSANRAANEERMFSNSIVVTAMIFAALKKLDEAFEASNVIQNSVGYDHHTSVDSDIKGPLVNILQDGTPFEVRNTPSMPSASPNGEASLCEDFASLLSEFHTMSRSFDPTTPSEPSDPLHRSQDTKNSPETPSVSDQVHQTLPIKRRRSECLPRVDCRHVGISPQGSPLKEYENLAWRVSYNIARDRHFLSQTGKRRKASLAIQRLVPPIPNIAAVYMVEQVDEAYRQHIEAEGLEDLCTESIH
jgi:hypothetical protein